MICGCMFPRFCTCEMDVLSLSSLMKEDKALCAGYSDRHLEGKFTSCIKSASPFPEVTFMINLPLTCPSAYSTLHSISLTG